MGGEVVERGAASGLCSDSEFAQAFAEPGGGERPASTSAWAGVSGMSSRSVSELAGASSRNAYGTGPASSLVVKDH